MLGGGRTDPCECPDDRGFGGAEDLVGPQAPGLKGAVLIFGRRLPEYDLALIAASPVVLFGLWLLFYKTRWGTLVRAATQDRQMVAALGVNQRWLFTGVLFLGSALAGLGGAVQIPKGGADLLMDFNIIAAAFVVVVVGGMGSIMGAFLASVLLGILQTFGIQIFPSSTLVMMFLVMAVVLIFRPWGLLGKPEIAGQAHAGPPEQPLRPGLGSVAPQDLVQDEQHRDRTHVPVLGQDGLRGGEILRTESQPLAHHLDAELDDGTRICVPDETTVKSRDLKAVFEKTAGPVMVYLGIPDFESAAGNLAQDENGQDAAIRRYRIGVMEEVNDENTGRDPRSIQHALLFGRILIAEEDPGGFRDILDLGI